VHGARNVSNPAINDGIISSNIFILNLYEANCCAVRLRE
jgi:hypothetical protein